MKSAHYDEAEKTLHITFRNGTVTPHYDCPKEVYDALCTAESPGKHYHAAIRGKYKTEK